MIAPVTYEPGVIDPSERLFEHLWENLPWERREGAPRRECWMTTLDRPYTYGRGMGERTYQPVPWTDFPVFFQSLLSVKTGTFFEGCFINGYEGPRDHLGWHEDDSPEIDPDRPIAILSLGQPREIWFREKGSDVVEKMMLEDGSLCLMAAGMQQTHQHRIPKSSEMNCGRRISFTYRGLLP